MVVWVTDHDHGSGGVACDICVLCVWHYLSDKRNQDCGFTSVWRDTMGVVTYGGGYLYGVPVNTVGWAENDYQDTDRSLAVLLSMDSTTHGVPVRHSEELAKGENRDLYIMFV